MGQEVTGDSIEYYLTNPDTPESKGFLCQATSKRTFVPVEGIKQILGL